MGDAVSRPRPAARVPGPELVWQPTRVAISGNDMGIKPTCKEVHRLTSEGLDRELSVVERARKQVHLMVCGACRTFDNQMSLLRRAMRQLPPEDNSKKD